MRFIYPAILALIMVLGLTTDVFHFQYALSSIDMASLGNLSDLSFLGLAMGATQAAAPIRITKSRILKDATFSPGQRSPIDLPCDTVLQWLDATLSGSLQVTYTGTYTASPVTSFDALVPTIQVLVNGDRVVKYVRPWLVSAKEIFAGGNQPERKSSAAATAQVPANPTSDGGWAVGTSTQYTTIRESLRICFRDILAREGFQELSFLDLSKASTAQVIYGYSGYESIAAANNAATGISYANGSFVISTTTAEAQDMVGEKFTDLKETTQSFPFVGQQNNVALPLNTGNLVRGIWIMVRDGDAARSLSNTAVTAISLKQDGFTPLRDYPSFMKLQGENRSEFHINAPQVAGVSRIDGLAYIDLLKNKNPSSALDCTRVKLLQLFLSTAASGAGATYTNAVEVTIQLDEYAKPA